MFFIALAVSRAAGMNYAQSASVSFTAAGNNFELAIAVAIGTFGAFSGQALAGTIGPLIEVPVLVGLVYAMLWLGPRLFPGDPSVPAARDARDAGDAGNRAAAGSAPAGSADPTPARPATPRKETHRS